MELLKSLKTYFYSLKVFIKDGKEITKKVNVFRYWNQNIKSLNKMWQYLKEIRSEFKFLLMRRIYQPRYNIEHTFGGIRNSGNAFNSSAILLLF